MVKIIERLKERILIESGGYSFQEEEEKTNDEDFFKQEYTQKGGIVIKPKDVEELMKQFITLNLDDEKKLRGMLKRANEIADDELSDTERKDMGSKKQAVIGIMQKFLQKKG